MSESEKNIPWTALELIDALNADPDNTFDTVESTYGSIEMIDLAFAINDIRELLQRLQSDFDAKVILGELTVPDVYEHAVKLKKDIKSTNATKIIFDAAKVWNQAYVKNAEEVEGVCGLEREDLAKKRYESLADRALDRYLLNEEFENCPLGDVC